MTPKVFIIILNWNDFQNTLLCIESLKSLCYENYKIIVVDNGSTDDSAKIFSQISGIEFHCNQNNLGFTGGNNKAIKTAINEGADYVWLLNNDTIVKSDCLRKLVEIAENDRQIGLLSPVIYDANDKNKIQYSVTKFDSDIPLKIPTDDLDIAMCWQVENSFQILLLGTALLIPRNTIMKIGLLDEKLFAYFEDSDYSVRSIKANLKNICVFDAVIWHKGHIGKGYIENRKPHYYYYMTRNSFYFWWKYASVKNFLKISWWNYCNGKKNFSNLDNEKIEAYLLGIWDALQGIGGEYNSSRKVPWFIRFWLR